MRGECPREYRRERRRVSPSPLPVRRGKATDRPPLTTSPSRVALVRDRCGSPHREAPPSVPSGDSSRCESSGKTTQVPSLLGYAVRVVSQRGGASRRGSESAARDQARGRAPLGEPRAGGEARFRASGSDGSGPEQAEATVQATPRPTAAGVAAAWGGVSEVT